MKTTFNIKFLSIVIIFLGFAAVANAQNTATATASATVVEGSSVRKDRDLNFGSIIKNASEGTLYLSSGGVMTYWGLTAPASGISPQTAQFTVTGTAGASFSVLNTTPSFPIVLTNTNGTGTMSITSIDIASWNMTIGSNGETTFTVGAYLSVPANPNVGLYQNTSDFVITIQFN